MPVRSLDGWLPAIKGVGEVDTECSSSFRQSDFFMYKRGHLVTGRGGRKKDKKTKYFWSRFSFACTPKVSPGG